MQNIEYIEDAKRKDNNYNYKEDSDSVDEDCKDNNAKVLKNTPHSACYKLRANIGNDQDSVFYFMNGDQVMYTAKEKDNVIHIGKGALDNETEFSDIAKITRMKEDYNIVHTNDQEFKINYALYYPTTDYSIKVSFNHNGKKLSWKPKSPKSPTSFNGEHNHCPIPSDKNMILQNHSLVPTYIFRVMTKDVYEVECHPDISPVVAFSIALSEIFGPLSYQNTI